MCPKETKKKVSPETPPAKLQAIPSRINRSINAEINRMSKLLRHFDDNPTDFRRFLSQPKPYLDEFGIDLSKYESGRVTVEALQDEIASATARILDMQIAQQIGDLIADLKANAYSSSTKTSYEYNFDNSSSSEYKYESHTGTERGTFSASETGTATDTEYSFSGMTAQAYLDMVSGPLISHVAMQQIMSHVENTLMRATQQQLLR